MRDLPLYRRVAEDLRREIESGKLGPLSWLPTESELMAKHGVSRNTVRGAVNWLVTRGLVETRSGQGAFVTKKIQPFVTTLSADPETGFGGGEGVAYMSEVVAQGRVPTTEEPEVGIDRATGDVATELVLAEGASVVSRRQKRFIDGKPWSLQTSYYPMNLVERGALQLIQKDGIEDGAVSYLEKTLGIKQASYRDKITVRPPQDVETAFFGLPDDGRVAVFETIRTAFSQAGSSFRVTVSVFPADRNQFIIEVDLTMVGAPRRSPPEASNPKRTWAGTSDSSVTAMPDKRRPA